MNFLEAIESLEGKITGGSEHGWQCYGPNARFLDFESEYAHASLIFDSLNQTVYVAEINDEKDNFAYRWMNPEFKEKYLNECKERDVDPNKAWDEKNWTDLETADDFLNKANRIIRGESFDARVVMPLNLDKEELFRLMTMAHERDITLNEMVEIVLQAAIDNATKIVNPSTP